MQFEHFAFNVPEAPQHTAWLVENLELRIVSQLTEEPWTTFLADSTGRVVIELYSNPTDPYPDYKNQHTLRFHFAFVSADPSGDSQKALHHGATLEADTLLPDGTHLVVIRDPWGLPIQYVKRAQALA